jgi:hypothetical protein
MRVVKWASVLVAAMGCGSQGLELEYSDPPVDVGSADAQFSADNSYAEKERTVYDIVHFPDSDTPTPLVIYIHGGGFLGGEKEELYNTYSAELQALVQGGAAVATIEYTLLEEDVDTEGVIKCLSDSRYALQYFRHHAEHLNIDPERVALAGTSAGAGTSLWLAFHDDMADSAAEDPVLAESTRVRAAAVWETQATYDLPRWTDDIFDEFGLDLFGTAEQFGLMQQLLNFYGITEREDLESPDIIAYRENVDMLDLMDGTDAPFWVRNEFEAKTFPISSGALFHHPFHARALVDAAVAVQLENVPYIPKIEVAPGTDESASAFLLRHLE